MKLKIAFLAALLTPFLAFAESEVNLTLDRLGIQSDNKIYFSVKNPGALSSCLFNLVYVDVSTSFGKGAHAVLLTAKSTGKNLTRLDYILTPSGGSNICNLSLVELKD